LDRLLGRGSLAAQIREEPLRGRFEADAFQRRKRLDSLRIRNDLFFGDAGFLRHARELRDFEPRQLDTHALQACAQLIDFAPRDPGNALQRVELGCFLTRRLDPRRQEPDARCCRSNTSNERTPGTEGTEERVDGALYRPQCRHNLRAEAPELLRDERDVTPPVANGTPDLLKCVGDAHTGSKRISSCLRESSAKSTRVALEW